jgi:uncharacterized protein YndB with AHSA1/START domain
VTDTQTTAVEHRIVVDAPLERAFSVFTDDMASWWPPEHHMIQGEVSEMIFEHRVGGQIIDRAADGSECRWARVLAYDPPHRVVFTWDISATWEIETDPDKTSEVEVRFIAESPQRTRVELQHSRLERHGEGWESVRDAVDSPGGWPLGLNAFAQRMRKETATP